MRVRFGPAGTPIKYRGETIGIPKFLHGIGLDAFEYQATYGVRISEETALKLRREAEKHDILLSLHAPYFINLNGAPETVEKSINRLVKSAWAAEKLNAYRIVFHPGFYGKSSGSEAIKNVSNALKKAVEKSLQEGFKKFTFSPETMGKVKTIGTLEEIIEICLNVGEHAIPTIDFAHLHARTRGGLKSKDDVVRVIDKVESQFGSAAVKPLHTHFTELEYGNKGEKKHLVMGRGEPNFKLIAEALIEVGIDADIISESPILELDALKMKQIYEELKSKR